MPQPETASVSTHASDTFPSPASFVAEICSGRRLAYPAGKGDEAIRRTPTPRNPF